MRDLLYCAGVFAGPFMEVFAGVLLVGRPVGIIRVSVCVLRAFLRTKSESVFYYCALVNLMLTSEAFSSMLAEIIEYLYETVLDSR